VEQKQQLTTLQRQLEQERQTVQRQAAAQQAAIDELKQQKEALIAERQREEQVQAKLLAKQRAETDAAVARANAATAKADKLLHDAQFTALAALLNDPANRELNRLGTRQNFKNMFADLMKKYKLSPEDADKFVDMLTANEMAKNQRAAAIANNTLDVATALAQRDSDQKQLEDNIRSWLGDEAVKDYVDRRRIDEANQGVASINNELKDKPLSDEVANKLRDIIKAEPELNVSIEDFFRSPSAIDQLLQQLTDRGEHILKQASAFLTPEQMAAANTVQSNFLTLIRKQLALARQLFTNSASTP
jgi:hypothetical protein